MAPDPARLAEIDAVFAAALDLVPAARPAFLDQRCAGDPELRREVESLLGFADRGVDTLLGPMRAMVSRLGAEESADAMSGRAASSSATAAIDTAEVLRPGATFGPYRVIGPLGRGGMGVVALAERADGAFAQQVAIKVLPYAGNSPEAVRRFTLERQILARLSHPHIAHLLDGGVDERGLPYLVMERVEGLPLDRYCDDHALPVDARLRLLVAIARAVHAAHRNLVVHRDLKPANLLITADGTPRLLDFGIAKLVDPASEEEGLTATAARLLTPTYASPEQVRGEPITTASDIYQLGLLLYEQLTGRRPQAATSNSLAELVRLVCQEEPAPPSRAVLLGLPDGTSAVEIARRRGTTPARLARRCRSDLDAIVGRALEKDPERRYGSAEELAADLERHLDGQPVQARCPTLAYRWRKFLRRNAAAAVATGLAIVLTLGYALAVTRQARELARERNRAEAERGRAEIEAETAREVERFVLGIFEVSDPSESRGATVTARELLAGGAGKADQELAGRPAVQARMLSTLGHVQGRLGLLDEGIALQRRALALRRRAFGGEHVEVAESALRLGTLWRKKGKHDAAAPLLEEAAALYRRLRPGALELAEALAELGSLRYFEGDYDAAERIFAEGLAVRRKIGDPETVAAGLNNMGLVLGSRGRPEEAVRYYREALALNRQVHGDRHTAVSVNLFNVGRALQDMEDYAGAQPVFEEVLAIERAIYGPDHPEVGTDLTLVGNNLVKLGQLERAEPLLDEALRVLRAKLDPEHPRIVSVLQAQGELRLAQGRFTEAETQLRAVLAMRRKRMGPSHPLIALVLLPLGRCLAAQGHAAEAEAAWREALAMIDGGQRPRLAKRLRAELAD